MTDAAISGRPAPVAPFISRVALRNYRSIAACDVALEPLTFLVGPNGAGKSNFLDALAFLRDALRSSLDFAVRERSGVEAVRRRSNGHPHNFGIRVEFRLPSGQTGHYAFQIEAHGRGAFRVQREDCLVDASDQRHHFSVRAGKIHETSIRTPPACYPDRLFLVNASGLEPFRALYDALGNMGFYNLNPRLIKDLQTPDDGSLLASQGDNLASVLERMAKSAPEDKRTIEELLSLIVPSVEGVDAVPVGPKETLELRQAVAGAKFPWRFPAVNMSDGTLRALGILVALFQSGSVPLVGIEEPEATLHPAAARLLMGALRSASRRRQVLITSHSPDLLDDDELDVDEILGVAAKGNVTYISAPDEAGRDAIRQRLFTPGELLRLDQIAPSFDLFEKGPAQLDLFGGLEHGPRTGQ